MFNYDIIEGSMIIIGFLWLGLVVPLIIKDIKNGKVTKNENK